MPKRKRETRAASSERNGLTVGRKGQLWPTADALRGAMDATEDKHVIPGLMSKYISDAFEEHRKHSHVLTLGPCGGAAPQEYGRELLGEVEQLVMQLREQQAKAARSHKGIARDSKELGFVG